MLLLQILHTLLQRIHLDLILHLQILQLQHHDLILLPARVLRRLIRLQHLHLLILRPDLTLQILLDNPHRTQLALNQLSLLLQLHVALPSKLLFLHQDLQLLRNGGRGLPFLLQG